MTNEATTSNARLLAALTAPGLIQFGQFEQADGSTWPVAMHLGWLPSYPAALRIVAESLAPLLDGLAIDRVLSTPGALPIATALALETEMPVVYASGDVRSYTMAFAIEGAYDVGHPTALLSDVLLDAEQATAITTLARKVGLNVRAALAVIDLGLGAREALEAQGWAVRPALTLREILPALEAAGDLPPAMHASVEAWIEACRRNPDCG